MKSASKNIKVQCDHVPFFVLTRKLLDEVVDETIVEVLTAQVRVTDHRFDLKNSCSEIDNEDIVFGGGLLVKTGGDN